MLSKLPTRKLGILNSDRSSNGRAERFSTRTNATSEATERVIQTHSCPADHPSLLACVKASRRVESPTAEVTKPAKSSRRRTGSRGEQGFALFVTKINRTHSGTLRRKIDHQPNVCVMIAPTTAAEVSAHINPIRETPTCQPVTTSAAGATNAAPTPCATRGATRAKGAVVRPAASDAMANAARPPHNMRREPTRSANMPPTSARTANASVYALTTHWSSASVSLRSWPMVDNDGTTAESSISTMNVAPQAVATASQGRKLGLAYKSSAGIIGCRRIEDCCRRIDEAFLQATAAGLPI